MNTSKALNNINVHINIWLLRHATFHCRNVRQSSEHVPGVINLLYLELITNVVNVTMLVIMFVCKIFSITVIPAILLCYWLLSTNPYCNCTNHSVCVCVCVCACVCVCWYYRIGLLYIVNIKRVSHISRLHVTVSMEHDQSKGGSNVLMEIRGFQIRNLTAHTHTHNTHHTECMREWYYIGVIGLLFHHGITSDGGFYKPAMVEPVALGACLVWCRHNAV